MRCFAVSLVLRIRAHSSDWNNFTFDRWSQLIELRQPLLPELLPNPAFMLAIAERCCRYAGEMGWPEPQATVRIPNCANDLKVSMCMSGAK